MSEILAKHVPILIKDNKRKTARIRELEAVVAKITIIVDDHAEFDDAMQDIHAILAKLEDLR